MKGILGKIKSDEENCNQNDNEKSFANIIVCWLPLCNCLYVYRFILQSFSLHDL